MASAKQIETRVLQFFRSNWSHIVKETRLREDLLLRNQQILDIGVALATELGCDPTTSQIVACKTVGQLIALLQKKSFAAVLATISSMATHPQLNADVASAGAAATTAGAAAIAPRPQLLPAAKRAIRAAAKRSQRRASSGAVSRKRMGRGR